MSLAAQLTRALERAGIPVWGVSIGDEQNRATWIVQYRPSASAEQRTQGDALVQTFDPSNDPTYRTEQADAQFDGQKLLKAVAIWTAQKLGVPLATARSEILAIYRTL